MKLEEMTAQTLMLHVRVDDEIKRQAIKTLDAMGLSVSDAVRLFLRRVVMEQAFPLELKVPNTETRAAIEESRQMMVERKARFATANSSSITTIRAICTGFIQIETIQASPHRDIEIEPGRMALSVHDVAL